MPRRTIVVLLTSAWLLASACQVVPAPAGQSANRPPAAPAASAAPLTPGTTAAPYVFGWGERGGQLASPRGGSTRGAPVTLAAARELPLQGIASAQDAFARDRAAILALAGDYRVSFHFMESLGLISDYQPARPYHSWATEHVRVIEDTGRFISLQHTLVMFFARPNGNTSEPFVTKHWRQDWTYEDTDLHTFRGEDTWARRRPEAAEVAGAWSQAVYQVDDSPRYESLGRWDHSGNRSVWTSEHAWRPLPRREHTVRKDYDVMEGVHRIVLTPTGWVHEQNNWKRVAGESAGASAAPTYIAAELGLDRYERITSPSLAPAEEYWSKTNAYWAAVRRAWAEVFARNERFVLLPEVDGRRLFEEHLAFADRIANGDAISPAQMEEHARSTVTRYVKRP